MKLLILGGTGNISTAITRVLQTQGHDLTLFNSDGTRPDWLQSEVKVLSGDRKNYAAFEQQLAGLGPWDCVVDMIAFEPEDAECDVRVFRGRTQQFIFCSTVDVYGKTPSRYPVTEETGIVSARPSFAYGWKKVQCEQTMWAAHQRGDFALTVLRPTFTYNETWSPGIHSFGGQSYHLDRLLKGKPFILHGDGTSIWVATYRDDTASAFVGAVGNSGAFGQAYNVSGEEWMTHNHIWRTLARLLDAPEPDFVYIPTELLGKLAPTEAEWCVENFRHNNIFDNAKAKRDLGFRYTVKFEDGARRCLDWLRANNRIEDCAKYPFYDRLVESWRRHEAAMVKEIRTGSDTGSAGGPPASPTRGASAAGPAALPPLTPSFAPANRETSRVITQVVSPEPHLGWYSRGFLPHWDHPGMIQSITFRLHDAVPAEVIQEWKAELDLSSTAGSAGGPPAQRAGSAGGPPASPPRGATAAEPAALPEEKEASPNLRRLDLGRRIARYEDAGCGACWLREARIGQLVEGNLLHFDGQRYRLLAWCVMPNHVHALIETREHWPLADVVHSWKSYTAHAANRILGRQGEFWQREYHDRYIRNAEHYLQAIRYIEDNPVKARLAEWPGEWPWSSAKFRAGSAGGPPASSSPEQRAAGPAALPVMTPPPQQ